MNTIIDISNDPNTGEIRKIEIQAAEGWTNQAFNYTQYIVA
jgi:hypothetical protein